MGDKKPTTQGLRLLVQGQEAGTVPRARALDLLGCFKTRYPDHRYALLGGGDATLLIHPPLDTKELETWPRQCLS